MSQPPQWQPLYFLPTLAPYLDGMLNAHEEQYMMLLEAMANPHAFDGYTVNRIIEVFTTVKRDLPLFDELLRCWSAGNVTIPQRQEIIRLQAQTQKIHKVADNVLSLANDMSIGTIEKLLAKSGEHVRWRGQRIDSI